MPRIVAMLTDFGLQDGYVAEMRGVVMSHDFEIRLVDITHEIAPQDVRGGAYVLSTVIKRFPQGTVYLCVVDPGVGTARRPIVVRHRLGTFVGPDNGLFTPILGEDVAEVVEIVPERLGAVDVSRTFHGRDLFAPAAARAAVGEPIHCLGNVVTDPIVLQGWDPVASGDGIKGRVLHIDRFGNAITNIPEQALEGRKGVLVKAGEHQLDDVAKTYGDVAQGQWLALFGSQRTLELSINGGNAAETLDIRPGDSVSVSWEG